MWLLRHVFRFRVAVARDNLRRCFPQRCWPRDRGAARPLLPAAGAGGRRVHQDGGHVGRSVALAPAACTTSSGSAAETDAGRSVLLLGAHQCNWEWALQATVLYLGVPIDAAYKPLHSAALTASCAAALPLRRAPDRRQEAGARGARVAARLQVHGWRCTPIRCRPRAAASVADFLGRETAFYPGPAEIARCTGCTGVLRADAPLPAAASTRFISCRSARPASGSIRRSSPRATRRWSRRYHEGPADWTWIHRRWKLAPPPRALTPGARNN